MTGGNVVILGDVGDNFAAGMTGGMAFIYDEKNDFEKKVNPETVIWQRLDTDYWKKFLKELILKHGYSIKKLKKSEGRILIKLIDRETKKTSYEIIRIFRNTFSASFWQLTARLFGHNLHSIYDKNRGEDRIIEYIINRIDNENLINNL